MDKFFKFLLAVVLAAGAGSVLAAGIQDASWTDLAATKGVAGYHGGQVALCDSYAGVPDCVVTTPDNPPPYPCLSAHTTDLPGKWVDLAGVASRSNGKLKLLTSGTCAGNEVKPGYPTLLNNTAK